MNQTMKRCGKNCYTYGNKCIALNHTHTWDLIRGNPSLASTSSNTFLLLPLSPPVSFIILYQNPWKLPDLILIKLTQSTSPIQLLHNFETTTSFKKSFPQQIPSISYWIITWLGMNVKERILSVALHGWLTDDSKMIILGIFTNNTEKQKHFLGENFQ